MYNGIPGKFHAIDAHTHLNFMLGKNYSALRRDEAAAMLECGDRFGIERFCVSLPYDTPDPSPEEFRAANNIIMEALELSSRFIGFCFVNPGFSREACDEILRCIRDGWMVGVKLYHQYRIDDPQLDPILNLCGKLGCPVLMHAMKGPYPPSLSNAEHFLTATKRFPEVNFIQAHIGGGGDWEWNLRVLEERAPNHFIDTGGSVIDSGMIRKTVEVMGCDRVLFATDMFVEEGVGKVMDAGFDDVVLQKILHDNAAGLFKLGK